MAWHNPSGALDQDGARLEKDAQKKARNRERAALRRAMETEEERSLRLEASRRYSATKRAQETEEQKAERRSMDRKRAAERRARETEWEREHRLALGRQRAAERRVLEREEDRESTLTQNRQRLALKAGRLSLASAEDHKIEDGEPCPHHLQAEQEALRKGVGQTFQEVEQVPVSVGELEVNALEMASASAQPQATVEQTALDGIEGGGDKRGELKQEVVEIKEFRAVDPNLERHYNELLKVISEIGRDVKPAYTNNKVSTDRLRKNIMMARGIVRECVQDVDRLAAVSSSSDSSS